MPEPAESHDPHLIPDERSQQVTPAEPDPHSAPTRGYMSAKQNYLKRLRRIEGQARGIHRMIDEDKYCIDILTQISALNSALENVALGLLQDHLHHCLIAAQHGSAEELEAKIQEATSAIQRLVKS